MNKRTTALIKLQIKSKHVNMGYRHQWWLYGVLSNDDVCLFIEWWSVSRRSIMFKILFLKVSPFRACLELGQDFPIFWQNSCKLHKIFNYTDRIQLLTAPLKNEMMKKCAIIVANWLDSYLTIRFHARL